MSNRCFQVKIEDKRSLPKNLNVGVPQGGNLSPLLFNCFIDDICQSWTSCTGCRGLLFADDLKIYKIISSQADCLILQQALDNISSWCQTNKILINISKTVFTQFSRKREPIDHVYLLDDYTLKKTTVVKDLGIFIDYKLYFHDHIDFLIKSCKKIWFHISIITKYATNYHQIKTLYLTLIRSKLEYGAIVWSILTNTDLKRVEHMQNKLTHKIIEKFGPTCAAEAKLVPLERRCKILLALFVFNTLINKIDNCEFLNNIGFSTTPNSCRLKGLLSLVNYNNFLHKIAISNYNIFRSYFQSFEFNTDTRIIWKNFDT